MANVKITELTAYTNPASTDVLPIVDVGTDTTKKVTIADLLENAGSGTAGAPAFAFDGDSDTGIYRPGADQVAISTNGTGRLFIDSSGNVGIGTSLPNFNLSVKGSADSLMEVQSSSNNRIIIEANTSGNNRIYARNGANGNGTLEFRTGTSTETMRIDNSGNVGIGTTSPSYKLDVDNAVIQIGNATDAFVQYKSTAGNWHVGANSSNAFAIYSGTYGSGTPRMRIDSSGNVGIGTTSPGANLDVASSTGGVIRLTSTNTSAAANENIGKIEYYTMDADGAHIGAYVQAIQDPADAFGRATALTFGTNNISSSVTERLRIDRLGNVGIGTTPEEILHIKGPSEAVNLRDGVMLQHSTAASTADTGLPIVWSGYINSANPNYGLASICGRKENGTDGNAAGYLQFATGNSAGSVTEKARLDSSGRLLVGTSSASVFTFGGVTPRLQVEGTDASTGTAVIARNSNDANGAGLIISKSRGTTAGSNTIVSNNDTIADLRFEAGDGTQKAIAASISAQVDGTPGANDMPGRLVFSTTADGASSPTERMRIAQDGKLTVPGVYSFTTADAANVRVTAAGDLIRSTSSLKYKTDVETLENTYADAILNCRPVWFRSLSATDNPSWGYWGFIAEEVAEIDPRLVSWKTTDTTYDENGSAVQTACDPEPEGVQYDRFVPHLLNLIKRQKEQIEAMEARLSALEAS